MRAWPLLLLLSLPLVLVAQRPQPTDPEFTQKDNSFVLGAHLHSYGFGVDLQYRKRYTDRVDLLFSYNIAAYKNRGEGRTPSDYVSQGGRDYIFDKVNYCYINGFTVGAQYKLVGRSEFNRVQISAGGGIGPSIALLKPYLLDVFPKQSLPGQFVELQVAPYAGPVIHPRGDIFGQADFFSGFGNIKAQFGLKVRGDVTIDLSGNSFLVRAIHLGLQADLFGKDLPLLYAGDNKNSYFGGFVGVVLGSAW
jgi:hypothetical protein